MIKKTLSWYKKKYWNEFSVYIRRRDSGICFTCQKKLPDYYDRYGNLLAGWKSGEAGHFITAKSCGLALYFHEQNVHCQCHYCNVNLSGNWVEYERRIIEVYGQDVCEELKQLKWTGKVKYTIDDYQRMREELKKKILGLDMRDQGR